MPPRTNNQVPEEFTRKSFELLLELLKTSNSNPHRSPQKTSTLLANCPLPGCNPQGQTPLQIETRTARFHCNACGAEGTPTAFAARLWLISASHAHALIDHYEIPDLLEGRPPMTPDMLQTRMDTFPLGVAMRFYRDQLTLNYPPLSWLAKLQITPAAAKRANIGYSPGDGLKEALAQAGLSQDQIKSSTLFAPNTGLDRFSGNIVLADTDHTGAVTWLVAADPGPDSQRPGLRLNPNLPHLVCLPFKGRSALIGLHRAASRTMPALLTDDIRTFAAGAANGLQPLLVVQRIRNEPPDMRSRRLDYITENITNRARMSALIIATHDPFTAAGVRDRIAASMPDLPLLASSKSLALRIASAQSDTIHNLLNEDTFHDRAQRARQELAAHPAFRPQPSHDAPNSTGDDNERTDSQIDG